MFVYVAPRMFCVCVGIGFVDLTWERVHMRKVLRKVHFLMTELDFPEVTLRVKLQTLVYDILPSTTAVFSYAIGSRKLSANEQCFVGAQTEVILLQTTQIISHVCFITNHVAQIKPKSFESTRNSFFVVLFFVYVHAWALGCFQSYITTQTFRRVLTASVDSCAEIKSAPSVA